MERFNRLAHSVWDCKYHIVWIPKYRRKEIYGSKRRIVVDGIKQWSRIKGIDIIEDHAMSDHIHLCVGKIYIGSAKIVESPLYVDDRDKHFECEEKRFYHEPIVILDPDGHEIRKIDTFDAIIDSDLAGLFNNNGKDHYEIETCDPLHLNDVRILTEDMAGRFPRFRPGDLLVSFRSLNGVGVLDPETKLFKWFYVGALQSQHSPRFHGNNRVLVFDNLGGLKKNGISRIMGIDVTTGEARTVFPKAGVSIPSRSFFSKTAGHIEVHPDQQRMLVSWTHQGLIWEIDIESGEVLWEAVNTHKTNGRHARVSVYTSFYVHDVNFPMNRGKSSGLKGLKTTP